jgi:mRNA-degrading endonuclease RelE of RelBE toxin-antitoxin system
VPTIAIMLAQHRMLLPALRPTTMVAARRTHLNIGLFESSIQILDAADRQLLNQPYVETRNRKPMRPNPVAPWELRIGNLRVYYEVTDDLQRSVTILAIGVKERDRVRIGREIIRL